jgi:DNA repair ATPase RecN
MIGPTDEANAEERIARIEKMVGELGGVERQAWRLAADVREKAERIAAEVQRVARAQQIVAELETLEEKADQIAAEVADKAAKIAAELAALKKSALEHADS